MKKIIPLIILSLALFQINVQAENTGERIYTTIFETQCSNSGCHNNLDVAGGLDLQGLGTNPMAEVRANLYNETPTNELAAAKNHRRLYAGDPYRSQLFRLVNHGLAGDVILEPGEDVGDIHSSLQLSDIDRELIRQWILFDAAPSGEVVAHDMIEAFYAGEGEWAIDPQSPPAPPSAEEGFQIHLGPFFIPPWESAVQPNLEYLSKYNTHLAEAIEVYKMDVLIGASHHFIMYRFNDDVIAENREYGLRDEIIHDGIDMVTGHQQSELLELPEGTAFRWGANTVLDLNAHVINYSTTSIQAADVYVNIFTQENGTAAQEMKSQLLPNPALYIPGDGEEHVIEAPLFVPVLPFTLHVWQMSSHTHKLATSFDVWLRNADGSKGEHVLDASRYNGIPECEWIGYDYQHPPTRTFSPFLPIPINTGIIQRATYVNCVGCPPVTWGNTTNDEMMITGILYVESLDGIVLPDPSVCFEDEVTGVENTAVAASFSMSVYPNPAHDLAIVTLKNALATTGVLKLYDLVGKEVLRQANLQVQANVDTQVSLDVSKLNKGMYIYTFTDKDGRTNSAKMIIE